MSCQLILYYNIQVEINKHKKYLIRTSKILINRNAYTGIMSVSERICFFSRANVAVLEDTVNSDDNVCR